MNQKFIDRPFVVPALIIGAFFVVAMGLLGSNIANRGSDSTIVVTGSVISDVRSDKVTWQIGVQRTAYVGGTSFAYEAVSRDANIVKAYFEDQKLASSSITASVISTDENYKQNQNDPTTFIVRETLTIQTTDVDKIDQLSRGLGVVTAKISPDTRLVPYQPEYYISALPGLRVSLLSQAIKDARARAVSIASSGSTKVGALKSASSGVVQVLAPNSTNVEDYGSYDTSTIQKQVMVSIRATFYVK